MLQPFLIILVMMALLQFSGQGAVTFYTAQIFKVGDKLLKLYVSEIIFNGKKTISELMQQNYDTRMARASFRMTSISLNQLLGCLKLS